MKKQNEIDRDALAQRIRVLDGLSADDKSALLELLNQKKYGLVWENKPENVEEELRTHIPVLEEVKERFVPSENPDAPNHILIEGDNLQALTTLAYTHEGKIDVIYIDPPYNTGNKDFVYNDSYVDSEDSYRHSKWLSFMEKRLRIARRLLSDKGVIFISIDDNELANLKLVCDEIFAAKNCLSTLVWDLGTGTSAGHFTRSHEYILVFAKNRNILSNFSGGSGIIDDRAVKKQSNKNNKSEYIFKAGTKFEAPDNTEFFGSWGGSEKSELISGRFLCKEGKLSEDVTIAACWTQRNQMDSFFANKDTYDSKGQKVIEFYFRSNGKLYCRKERSIINPPSVLRSIATTKQGSSLLTDIFPEFSEIVFPFSKPIQLLEFILNLFNGNSTILDFFAGSGTTLHATMQLNAEDGGHRQCILVTNNENGICENVTYERNRRVIQGYTDAKGNQVDGLTDNKLRYYKVNLVDRENSSDNRQKLMQTCTDLLCIKENIYNETAFGPKCVRPQFLRFFSNNNGDALLIIFIVDSRLVDYVNETVSALPDNGKRIKTYVYSENDYPYSDDFAPVASRLELVAMPAAMRNALRNVLPDPHKTPVLDVEENTAADGEMNFNDLSQD